VGSWEDKTGQYYYESIEGGHGGAADAKQSAFMTALAYVHVGNSFAVEIRRIIQQRASTITKSR
jgi:hypothetical protein